MTRYSEDGGGMDERVAVLEFELRKARENISALRANLTVVTESESSIPDKNLDRASLGELPIKPHEQRALNFLVYEYLLSRSYKLTSITFSDENEDQDFEDWEDVGLNIPKPPDLIQVYREFSRSNGYDKPPSANIAVQTDFEDSSSEESKNEINRLNEEIDKLKAQTTCMEKEKSELQQLLTAATSSQSLPAGEINLEDAMQTPNSNSTTPDKFELLDTLSRENFQVTQEIEEDDSASAVISLVDTDPGDKDWTRIQLPRIDVEETTTTLPNSPLRHLPAGFKREVLLRSNISCATTVTIEDSLKSGVTRETLPVILARSLPRIVPNVILNKREELVPLILSTIRLQPEPSEREKLLQLLFNLKKRPNDVERSMILAGLIAMAKLEENSMDSEEILGVCWEQSQHKHPERRLLAAECCLALAPYTSSGVRNSLMLPMLQQMLLDDREYGVRATVVRSLGLIVALMDDPDKYFQCEELTLTALDDGSSEVIEAASSMLIPILAQWALSLKRLQSHLLPRITSKLKNLLKPSSHHSPSKDHKENERIIALIEVLQLLLPHCVVTVATSSTVQSSVLEGSFSEFPEDFMSICRPGIGNPEIFCDDPVATAVLLNTFFENSWENESWPELEWLSDKLIPDLLDIFRSIDVNQEPILNALLSYVESLCVAFGQYISRSKIQKNFETEINALEKQLINLTSEQPSNGLALIPAYLTILSTLNLTELSKILKQFVIVLSMSSGNVTCLRIAVSRLSKENQVAEHILGALWDGVVHQRSSVRCTTAELFSSAISVVNDKLATSRIAPAIVTLASDPDIIVRAAAIPALGRLVTECGAREARDKGRLTLETIAREPQGVPSVLAVPLVSTLAAIAPNCPQHFIEDVIVTQLTGITASALQQTRRIDLANALVEAYSILVYCPLSNQCVSGVLVPGLKHLDNLVNQILPQQKETVRSLLRETESRQDAPRPIERSSSSNSGLSLSIATSNVGQGVEDMRQRMSKMFIQKTSTPSIPSMSSIFRKK
ncbi:RAB11-binding protein RELCH homolog isoform X2 [Venturia canescens]|nr:RAB11-binding protein RELCH homolog isoform X2 [Venturia canescens]